MEEEKIILKKVKRIFDICHDGYDEKLQEYISLFCDKVKSLCKRKDFPKELNYMAVDFVKKNYLYYKDKEDTKNEQIQVTSATDNGQKVDFRVVENITKDDIDIDKVIAKNIAEISNYAYMGW